MATLSRQSPAFWDAQWEHDRPRWTEPLIKRAAEIFDSLPPALVEEYGFGPKPLADHLHKCSWRGYDFSSVAVEKAKAKGYDAHEGRCKDATPEGYVCAVAVLPNLSDEERAAFLDKVKEAPHAIFTVKPGAYRSLHAFGQYLRQWWPTVNLESVGKGWLAHCSHERIASKVLTVGSSTLLDFSGVLYTLASWQTHHGTFNGDVEFVVVDNHPEPTRRFRTARGFACPTCKKMQHDGDECPECAANLLRMKTLVEGEGARYIRWADKQGTYPGKNQLKVEALGEWVLTMDSHVLLTPETVATCLELIEHDPGCQDFFHFPCHLRSYEPAHPGRPASMDFRKQQWIYHGDGDNRGSVYGWTGEANKAGEPYPIAAMITSCYLLRRDAWMSARGYDPILGNYGGWEGPIQLKWWLMGRQVRSMRYRRQEQIERHGFLHHYHIFWNKNTRDVGDNKTMHVHTSQTKMRNFAASSAVIGGEEWVKRHCELKGWNFQSPRIQEGLAEGLKLRPWMLENIADPEWEDITRFFEWMKSEGIPGAMQSW